jgi:hypothetical protein
MKIAALQTEHEQGFGMYIDYEPIHTFPALFWKTKANAGTALPDVMTAEHAASLDNWEGSWSYLAKIPWIKVSNADQVRPADFPSKGLSWSHVDCGLRYEQYCQQRGWSAASSLT